MELFPKSNRDVFRRRIIVKSSDYDMLEPSSAKWRLLQWENVKRHDAVNNDTALEKEMEQTLGQINDFLHRLEITGRVHFKNTRSGKLRDWSKQQSLDRQFKEQVSLGHTLLGKVKELLDLEDAGFQLTKSYKSLSNKSSASGGNSSLQLSDANMSNCSLYSTEIRDVLFRLGHILGNRRPLPVQEIEIEKIAKESPKAVMSSERDSLKILTDHLTADNIHPIFETHPLKASDSSYTVTCRVFNITVEGKASEKTAAKKVAATKMLQQLVSDSTKKRLPIQITPFTDQEIEEAVIALCETEQYDLTLKKLCEEHRKQPPYYETDFSKQSINLRCYAFGLQGFGKHAYPTVAKRMAARDVLIQFQQRPRY